MARQQTSAALPEPACIPDGTPVSRGFDRVRPSESLSELLPTPGQSARITQSELMKLAAKSLAVANRTVMGAQPQKNARPYSPPRLDMLHELSGPVLPEVAPDAFSSGGTVGGDGAQASGVREIAERAAAALAYAKVAEAEEAVLASRDVRAPQGEGVNSKEPPGSLPSLRVSGEREEAQTDGAATAGPNGGGPVRPGDNPTNLRRRSTSRPQVVGSLQTIEEAGSYENEDLGC